MTKHKDSKRYYYYFTSTSAIAKATYIALTSANMLARKHAHICTTIYSLTRVHTCARVRELQICIYVFIYSHKKYLTQPTTQSASLSLPGCTHNFQV